MESFCAFEDLSYEQTRTSTRSRFETVYDMSYMQQAYITVTCAQACLLSRGDQAIAPLRLGLPPVSILSGDTDWKCGAKNK